MLPKKERTKLKGLPCWPGAACRDSVKPKAGQGSCSWRWSNQITRVKTSPQEELLMMLMMASGGPLHFYHLGYTFDSCGLPSWDPLTTLNPQKHSGTILRRNHAEALKSGVPSSPTADTKRRQSWWHLRTFLPTAIPELDVSSTWTYAVFFWSHRMFEAVPHVH